MPPTQANNAVPFNCSTVRWLLVALMVIEITGRINWHEFSQLTHVTLHVAAVFLTAVFCTYWKGISFLRVFGNVPTLKEITASAAIGFAILLVMVWADNLATPFLREFLAVPRFERAAESELIGYPWWFTVIVASLITPLSEELLFRGLIYQRLAVRWGPICGILISATVFGLVHDRFLGPFLIGIILAMLFQRTGSLYMCVLSHGVANLVGFSSPGDHAELAVRASVTSGINHSNEWIALASGTAMLAVLHSFWWPAFTHKIPYQRSDAGKDEPSHAPEPAAVPVTNEESSPSAR